MESDQHTDDEIRKILSLDTVAVVGMSRDPSKAAGFVPQYLSENGFDVIPINPNSDTIMGKKSYKTILDVDTDIDIVDIFRPSDQVLPIVRDAIKKKPQVIWLQEGIHNPDAEALAEKTDIKVVFNRCMLAEHRRLF